MTDLEFKLPCVPRGKNKTALQGETRSTADNSINASVPPSEGLRSLYGGQWTPFTHMSMTSGNYASPAHLDSNDVAMGYVLFYLRCKHRTASPPEGAFFRFDKYYIGFTPRHGSMVCFEPAQVLHSTAIPDSPGLDCECLGSAVCIQKDPVDKAVESHAGFKAQSAQQQKE
ncbi:hypothetical protein WJX77_007290 [Trebouxia sp. C0004]